MNKLQIGQLVISKTGRDKDRMFVIIEHKDEYVYLVDGRLRRLENPKKKKIKHIQPTNTMIDFLHEKLSNDHKISNSEIRKAIQLYQSEKN